MFTRGNRELLNPNPTYGPEEPWTVGPIDSVDHASITQLDVVANIGSDQVTVTMQNISPHFTEWTLGIPPLTPETFCRFVEDAGAGSWTSVTGWVINDGDELRYIRTGSRVLTVTLAANATSNVDTTVGDGGANILSEVSNELIPSDPTNSLQGTSNLFYEKDGDLILREVADGTSDLHFSQISGEFVPDEI